MKIGLSAWIIQDGNYGDFAVGDEARFALEFHANSHTIISEAPLSAVCIKDSTYCVIAQVVFKKDALTIIDFGYRAFSEQLLDVVEGDWIKAAIYIGIDPFMYFEGWARKDGIPEISYTWCINQIFLETTPRIEEKPRYFVRDKNRFSEVSIQKTDAWKDDEGHGDYVLECEKIQ
jgi:hypothetical protein